MASTILQPSISVAIVPATQAVENTAQKILFVGQKTIAGSAPTCGLVENILNDNSEDTLFGENSMLAAMVRAAKKDNQITQMDAIALEDGGSFCTGTGGGGVAVAATGNFNSSGTATEDGVIEVTVGSERNHTYDIAVLIGDTATVFGDAVEAAINGDPKCPVTAINTTGTIALTAVNGGTYGNTIGLGLKGEVAGLTRGSTAMAGGAVDPALTGVFDVVGEKRYQTIIWPYAADTLPLTNFLDPRFNVTNRVQDGIGITSVFSTLAGHLINLNLHNSQSVIYMTDKAITTDDNRRGPSQLELEPVKSSYVGAIRALRLTDGASISRYVITTNGPLDSFGGAAIGSKPYFNTATPNLPLIPTIYGWNDTEIEQLHDAGGTVLGQNPPGNVAIMGEVVTTYKNDNAGNPDISFKYANYVDTSSGAREYFFNNLRARFAQSRLTEGAVLAGRDMANALTIQAFCEKLYQDLSGPDFVLVQAGEDATRFFKQNLSVTLDLAQGKATIQMLVPIVTQLREIIATMKIAFSTQQ